MTADDIPYITDEPETRPQWSGRADLHARIKAAVAEARALFAPESEGGLFIPATHPMPWPTIRAMCDHADDVLARHYPARGGHDCWCGHGGTDEQYDPQCPDMRALATAWLGDGWES